MAFFELDDVFTYQDANDIKKLWASNDAPSDPGTGEVWLDTLSSPKELKRYNGTGWDIIGEVTEAEVLNKLGTTTSNVGIGTTSPAVQLEVETTGEDGAFRVQRTDGATAEIIARDSRVTMGSRENHDLRLVTNNDPKMAIDTTGNVGIGTTSPAYPLEVERTGGNAVILADRTDGASTYISGTDIHGSVGTATNHDLRVLTDGAVKMTVDTSGNVGIGTTTPAYRLEVQDTGVSAQIVANRTDGATAILSGTGDNGFVGTVSNHDLRLTTNNAVKMTIDTSGNVGIGTTTPGSELEVNGDAQISGKMISEMAAVTIANNSIYDTGIDLNSVGHLYIRNSHGVLRNGAVFSIGMLVHNTTNWGVARVAGSSAIYSVVKDTADKINVYAEGTGTVKIQNLYGTSINLRIGFIGVYLA